MPAVRSNAYRGGTTPAALRLALALALPFVAALAAVGTYLGKEVIVAGLWLGLAFLALLGVNPIIGIVLMTATFLLISYPTLFQTLGALTLNNVLGAGLGLILAARAFDTRDFSFIKNKQVLIFCLIGLGFLFATWHAATLFPLLQASRGRMYILDRSSDMGWDFFTRIIFLIFLLAFVRTRRDVGALFLTFMIALYLAVPSALINAAEGKLVRGFRAGASLTAGSNPNRLAMICLIQVACWWLWSLARPGTGRRIVALGAIGTSMLALLFTGSRSGLLGVGVLLVILQTGPRIFRVPARHVVLAGVVGVAVILTVVPEAAWNRMIAFNPEVGEAGASSSRMREETIFMATRIVRDHPWTGIGLGKFREVSRQIYGDKFYRPPHNSFLWAASEGGVFVAALYVLLLWITWRDLQVVMQLAPRDPSFFHIAAAVRAVFLLYVFFSAFADLFLNPVTYILVGMVAAMRRYVETLPPVETTAVVGRHALVHRAAAA
jgi:hypothetical protein